MKAYKLVRKRKNGTYGSLFINRKASYPVNEWMKAENHPTKGYKFRPGWHCLPAPYAPHLKTEGRVWLVVEIEDYSVEHRPSSQGGEWYLANWMKILNEYK